MDIYIPASFFKRPGPEGLMNIVMAHGHFPEQLEMGKTYRVLRDDAKGKGFTAVVVGKQNFKSLRDLELSWPSLHSVNSLSKDHNGPVCLIQVRESTTG